MTKSYEITAKINSRRAKTVAICESVSDAAELETRLMEAIDNIVRFLRFVENSA